MRTAWYTIVNSDAAGPGRQTNFEIGLPRPLVGSVLDGNGVEQFGITESSTTGTDGSVTENLSVSFAVPAKPGASAAGIPLMGLNAQVSTSGGTLAGGQALYYGISAVDANGAEGGLSFIAMANVPAGTNTNQVTLDQPQLFVRCEFVRCLPRSQSLPDFANREQHCYRRSVCGFRANCIVAGPCRTTITTTPTSIGGWNCSQPSKRISTRRRPLVTARLNMLVNLYNGATVRITTGTGAGQEQTIASNTATTLPSRLHGASSRIIRASS